jgi:hypothetical protein
MSRPTLLIAIPFVLLVLFACSGCNQGEELGRVTGRVIYQGRPVPKGIVIFVHQQRKGIMLTADLRADGTFEVEMAGGFGLPLGEYQVAVSPPLMDHPLGPIAEPPKPESETLIPLRYREPATSPVRLTVGSGDNRCDIDLSRP